MTITVHDQGTVVQADGRLSRHGVAELEGIRMTTGPVTLDLTNLLSADDAGVAALRNFSGSGVRLIGVSPYMSLLLQAETLAELAPTLSTPRCGRVVTVDRADRRDGGRHAFLDGGPGAGVVHATFIVFLFSAAGGAAGRQRPALARVIARGLRNLPTRLCLGPFVFEDPRRLPLV